MPPPTAQNGVYMSPPWTKGVDSCATLRCVALSLVCTHCYDCLRTALIDAEHAWPVVIPLPACLRFLGWEGCLFSHAAPCTWFLSNPHACYCLAQHCLVVIGLAAFFIQLIPTLCCLSSAHFSCFPSSTRLHYVSTLSSVCQHYLQHA